MAFITGEGTMLHVALNRLLQHVMQQHTTVDQIGGRAVEPRGQRGVGEQEMAVLIDRIEPHGSVIHEVGQVLLLVAETLLDILAVADVLDHPFGQPVGPGKRHDPDQAPAAGSLLAGHSNGGTCARICLRHQFAQSALPWRADSVRRRNRAAISGSWSNRVRNRSKGLGLDRESGPPPTQAPTQARKMALA